jgi:desulfoferrodoxin-like iron-binding protein
VSRQRFRPHLYGFEPKFGCWTVGIATRRHPAYDGVNLEVTMPEVKKAGEVYRCEICGNVVEVKEAGGGELVCCGEPMKLESSPSS